MKSIIKICNMDSQKDAQLINNIIIQNDGVIATEICLNKKEITIIYNPNFLKCQRIIDSIEDLGYIVI